MIYRFADLRLDIGRRQLLRGGEPLELSSLSFDVLLALVEGAPDLVSYDRVIEQAWGPNRVVTPENLAQRMSLIRNALGDDASRPRYIEGVRSEGFRLIPAVEKIEAEVRASEEKKPGWRLAAAVLIVLAVVALGAFVVVDRSSGTTGDVVVSMPERKAIAVLPFANLSPDSDNAYYAAGIHEEILNYLAKLHELKVTSRTSVLNYADSELGVPEIAEELSVDAIIEGSVRYADDRIRVTVQLVDGASDQHLWSETYDRQFDDIFAIESDIAARVAQAMKVTYSEDERQGLEAIPTTSADAYRHYLMGSHYIRSSEVYEAIPQAMNQFQRAVELDPEFALAHAALSQTHIDMYWYGIDRADKRRQMALAAAQRARELQPDLPEARIALALYFYHGYFDFGAALQELDAVRDRLPSHADLYRIYAAIYRRMGRWEESVSYGNKAIELDPLNVEMMWSHSATFAAMRQFDEARTLIEKAIALAPEMLNLHELAAFIERWDTGNTGAGMEKVQNAPLSDSYIADHFRWWDAFYNRDFVTALEVIDRVDHFEFPNQPFLYPRESMRGLMYSFQGEHERAREHFQLARMQIEDRLTNEPADRGTANLYIMLGESLVATGDIDMGVEMTNRGLEELSPEKDAYFSRVLQYEAIMRVFLLTDPFGTALPMLNEFLTEHGGGLTIEGLLPDPRLDSVRDDPRFIELVENHRRSQSP